MLPPFKLGVAGKVGSGDQYMSWIALDDVVGVIRHALATTELSGPVNTVAPAPVTNLEFTRTLGRALARPTVLPMPALAARLLFGEMARELLVSGQRAVRRAFSPSASASAIPSSKRRCVRSWAADGALRVTPNPFQRMLPVCPSE